MVIPSLSTDAIIIATIGLVVVYSFLAGQQALIRMAISVYVGIVLAISFGDVVFNLSRHSNFGSFSATSSIVHLVLLALPVVLLQIGHYGGHARTHMLATAIVSVLTGLLIVSAALQQLDSAHHSWIDNSRRFSPVTGTAVRNLPALEPGSSR